MAQFNGLAANIETNLNKVTEITDNCTDTEYPSAAAVKALSDALTERIDEIEDLPHIIESGTGQDGVWTYRKWSDGTLECWANIPYTVTLKPNFASAYVNFDSYYPVSFVSKPTLTFSVLPHTWGHWVSSADFDEQYISNVGFLAYVTQNVEAGGTLCAKVIGKWK